jgi:hypothetical protein
MGLRGSVAGAHGLPPTSGLQYGNPPLAVDQVVPEQSHRPPTPPADTHTGSCDPGEHGMQMAASDMGSTPHGYVPGTGCPEMGWP